MNVTFGNVLTFVFGAIAGSFLNVCIHRMPRDLSIVLPGSFCPQCKAPIPWYHNIPLVSYLLLRGKCFRCKRSITPRYFLVELVSAGSWLFLWMTYGLSVQFGISVVFISLMTVVIMTDFETMLIPHGITIPGMILGLCFSFLNAGLLPEGEWYPYVLESIRGSQGTWYHTLLWGLFRPEGAWFQRTFWSLSGLFVGGGIVWLTAWIGGIVFRKEAMGGGDIMLLAMAGSFLGPEKAVWVFMLAPFIALPYALYYLVRKKEKVIPYGPFLAVMAILLFFKYNLVMSFLTTVQDFFFGKIYGV